MKNYSYPIDPDWSTREIVKVTQFLALVELANEARVNREKLQCAYQEFKEVVKSIGEEKRLGKQFEQVSGYSIYQTMQAAKLSNRKEFSV
ncbi:MAG: UPF0223 family protein [Streptococcaceae bacterium]|jgi:uncharacterized protein YktA (UPF0223 family)|nr:UPF0223 family protein [Streptococcaceae bacterium]